MPIDAYWVTEFVSYWVLSYWVIQLWGYFLSIDETPKT